MFKLNFSNARRLDDTALERLFNIAINGIEVHAKSSDTPAPWDYDTNISRDGKAVEIVGGIGPCGAGKATCTVSIPKDVAHVYYDFVIDSYKGRSEAVDAQAANALRKLLAEHGITFVQD